MSEECNVFLSKCEFTFIVTWSLKVCRKELVVVLLPQPGGEGGWTSLIYSPGSNAVCNICFWDDGELMILSELFIPYLEIVFSFRVVEQVSFLILNIFSPSRLAFRHASHSCQNVAREACRA